MLIMRDIRMVKNSSRVINSKVDINSNRDIYKYTLLKINILKPELWFFDFEGMGFIC